MTKAEAIEVAIRHMEHKRVTKAERLQALDALKTPAPKAKKAKAVSTEGET